jgi:hypothetical protein
MKSEWKGRRRDKSDSSSFIFSARIKHLNAVSIHTANTKNGLTIK